MASIVSRHFCFTSFRENEPVFPKEGVLYLIYGKEICPTTKRQHWQGYAELCKPMRIKAAQTLLGCEKCHFEKRKGTREQARDYCKKENDFKEFGNFHRGKTKPVLPTPPETAESTCTLCNSLRQKRLATFGSSLLSPVYCPEHAPPSERIAFGIFFQAWMARP